jgi:plasmid stabilization system protein ParE
VVQTSGSGASIFRALGAVFSITGWAKKAWSGPGTEENPHPRYRESVSGRCFERGKLGHPAAAVRLVRQIYSAASTLKQFPDKGRPERKRETRELVLPGLPWMIIIYEVSGQQPALALRTVLKRRVRGSKKRPSTLLQSLTAVGTDRTCLSETPFRRCYGLRVSDARRQARSRLA